MGYHLLPLYCSLKRHGSQLKSGIDSVHIYTPLDHLLCIFGFSLRSGIIPLTIFRVDYAAESHFFPPSGVKTRQFSFC